MDIVGLVGERVRLVPSDPRRHLDGALRWFNDPEVTASLEVNFGLTRAQAEEFFDRVCRHRETDLHWAIQIGEGRHIGFIALHQIHWRHRSAVGGLVIGEREVWGQGYATDAVRTRTRFAFEQMGLHRIEGHSIHPAMHRVYEKSGYRREGTARQKMWRDGRWHDAALFAILDADYFGGRVT